MEALLIIMFAMGLFVGISTTILGIRLRSIGHLRVDQSDPDDGPYLFLELTSTTEALKKRKYVTLDVKVENYISQK